MKPHIRLFYSELYEVYFWGVENLVDWTDSTHNQFVKAEQWCDCANDREDARQFAVKFWEE